MGLDWIGVCFDYAVTWQLRYLVATKNRSYLFDEKEVEYMSHDLLRVCVGPAPPRRKAYLLH